MLSAFISEAIYISGRSLLLSTTVLNDTIMLNLLVTALLDIIGTYVLFASSSAIHNFIDVLHTLPYSAIIGQGKY